VLIQNLTQRNRHLFASEVLPSDADGLADEPWTLLEDAVSAAANVLRGDPRQLLLAHRKREHEFPVGRTLRPHAEVDQVLPIKRGEQERRRHVEVREEPVRFSLGLKVRHLVLAHQGRHALIGERHPLARVFQSGPDDMPDSGLQHSVCTTNSRG
jgi:hypothetical protein